MKIGIAYINQDQSFNVYLDAIPFDRKLHIREDEARPRAGSHDAPGAGLDLGGIQ
jgi:hypothetical protein